MWIRAHVTQRKGVIVFTQTVTAASAHYCSSYVPNLLKFKKPVIISAGLLCCSATSLFNSEGPTLVGTSCHGPAHKGLTTWLCAMASWEWNVECCVCRAPFPASLTAQAHANDQYYWSTIDGLATKQEKLITTKALLSFNYRSSMAISAAQRHSPTLISNKMWCRWKNLEDER